VSEADRIDPLTELDAILDLGRRAPGSDAERRTALHLQQRLQTLGREAAVEPVDAFPHWALAYAILAAAGVGASVLAVYLPLAGAVLALATSLLTFIDAGLQVPIVRRPLGRRASQNVVSWGGGTRAGALVVVAHTDAGRGGIAHRTRLARRPIGALQAVFLAQLAILGFALARLIGLEGAVLTVAQFVPTLLLLVAVALLTDIALAGIRGGENDNASGLVTALRLVERGLPLQHFELHVVFTGARHAGSAGIQAFLKRHALPREATVFVNVERVGSGGVRYTVREGLLYAQRTHPQLTKLCEQIVEDELDAQPLTSRSASDAATAATKGFAAITITCRERGDYASGRVEERALDEAEAFCAELIERIDAEVGPSIVAPVDATALSEPQ
jgi:hypothetical protein